MCVYFVQMNDFEVFAEQVALANQLQFEILKRSSCQAVGGIETVACGKIAYLSLLSFTTPKSYLNNFCYVNLEKIL